MTGFADGARPGGPGRAVVVVALRPELREQLFTADAWQRLSRLADPVLVERPDDRSALADALTGADILVTGWGTARLDAELLAAAPRLELLAHTGGAVSPYATRAVFDRGVRVTQAGGAMARPVAEVALAFTLALLHRIHRFDHALRGGVPWAEAGRMPERHQILGCPIGVIGASRTGRAYIGLVRALGAEVTVADPCLGAADAAALGVRVAGLDEVLAASRITAVHAPALAETRHLLGARELALLPDGAGLVNTARSWLVDEDALLAELRSGRIDAALDVYDAEPLPTEHPLRALPNVLLTPHQAAATVEGRHALGDSTVAEIERHLGGRELLHEVGRDALARVE
ncbi:Phosphoglycerate dehydrogenase [Actinacidiphila alni]|uniref:Phosphoglycerate dehydrogenase n=1 Tax=Actinacidiphila alni TaxID=380248 RepID=A0A1I2MPR4_9ACTN|nr:hydroxyacid dehydrogenase [Actinacidiphila alni]SFF93555.1 Phosphoglycerate dehydrogenase [Actinacidiphila alni]